MTIYKNRFALTAGLAALVAGAAARAHIVPGTAPVFANTTTVITFAIEHGCAGHDSVVLEADIPSGITGARATFSDFAKPAATVDSAGNVTSFTWTKPAGDFLDALPSVGGAPATNDYAYYQIALRFKTPNTPFTTLLVPFHQTCKDPNNGQTTTVDWTDTSSGAANPPPPIKLYPARAPGWNKYTVPVAMTKDDLTAWFGDAQIVWKATAAFSANPNIAAQIGSTSGVTTLVSLAANDEIWVKY
jgi:periplasmic copper chaperone A